VYIFICRERKNRQREMHETERGTGRATKSLRYNTSRKPDQVKLGKRERRRRRKGEKGTKKEKG